MNIKSDEQLSEIDNVLQRKRKVKLNHDSIVRLKSTFFLHLRKVT